MATFEDETLTELVGKYKVLYDKAHPEFHRKDIKNNAWKEVAGALGTDGRIIKNAYVCITIPLAEIYKRDRYIRANRNLRSKDKS